MISPLHERNELFSQTLKAARGRPLVAANGRARKDKQGIPISFSNQAGLQPLKRLIMSTRNKLFHFTDAILLQGMGQKYQSFAEILFFNRLEPTV
jgi:hypothetical protein